jgi:hypothetical protein
MSIAEKKMRLEERQDGKLLEVQLTGKLEKSDYDEFLPEVDRRIAEQGKLRMLVFMHDFHGWSARAFWADLKFGLKHYRHIERLAIVGENRWERGMAAVCRPFTTAEVRYFDQAQVSEARQWVESS